MMRRPLRLRTRVALYFVGLLFCWGVLMVVSLGYLLSEASYRFFRDRGIYMARILAAECVSLVHYEDTTGLSKLFEHQMKSHPDIRYIFVLDAEGNPVLSTFPEGIPPDLLAVAYAADADTDVRSRLMSAAGELLYDYECRRAGIRVRLGVSLTAIQETNQHIIRYVLWIGAAGFLAVFGLSFYISRPVELLTRAIEQAVLLEHELGGISPTERGTWETSTIATRFQDLFNRLVERTKQLDASKKLAYLGELSASIAHEVNNPLGVIVMNSEFLAKRLQAGELSPAAGEEVKRLGAAARRATLAVQKLLQFARYSTSAITPRHRPTRIDAMVQETLDLLQDRIQVLRCTIRTETPDGLPTVQCDAEGIQQVIFNLLTNALDASAEGGEIHIRLAATQELFTLQVADQGEGMTDEVLTSAKRPFFTTKESGRGTGLGLAISDSIVQAHGGQLLLESQPGRGTTATIRLPLKGPSPTLPRTD